MQDVNLARIESDLRGFVRASYPEMIVRVEHWEQDPSRIALFFIEKRFEGLFRRQRYHYLLHLIPTNYYDTVLSNAIWFELAPDESIDTLADDPDEELIASITLDVLGALQARHFFTKLDEVLCPECTETKPQVCSGDFSNAKQALEICGFEEFDWSDVFHVLMGQGAFCDCEILYNASTESRLKAKHWRHQFHEAADSSRDVPQ